MNMAPGPVRQQISLVVAVVALFVALLATPAGHFTNNIVDVSWPNCHQSKTSAQAGIVGVTGGLDFRPNPCLGEEPGWFNHVSLYMNTGYPDTAHARRFTSSPKRCARGADDCLAYNYGYNAALYAVQLADRQGAHANLWWLDVETENSWSASIVRNREALQGSIDAIRRSVPFVQVGIYSSPLQWSQLVGKWHNQLPSWVATGATSQGPAQAACRQPSFTGGSTWLAQYTPKYLDIDYACNQSFARQLYQPGR